MKKIILVFILIFLSACTSVKYDYSYNPSDIEVSIMTWTINQMEEPEKEDAPLEYIKIYKDI